MRPLRTPRSAGRFFVTREESLCKNNTVCTKFTTSTFCNKAMSAVAKKLASPRNGGVLWNSVDLLSRFGKL